LAEGQDGGVLKVIQPNQQWEAPVAAKLAMQLWGWFVFLDRRFKVDFLGIS
jgi:hypothetical protein